MLIKDISRFCLVAFIFVASTMTLFAQPSPQPSDPTNQNLKTILLKDGTKIKGKLVGVQDNTYSIETNHFGKITVKDGDVVSISNADVPAISTSDASTPSLNPSPSLKGQVEAVQQQMMADPEFMSRIQELMQDPKFVEIIKDPEFVNAIMSYDREKIKSNPKFQMLLQNSKIQQLMQRMGEKHLQHQ